MVEIQGRLVSLDVFGEPFCCDLHACRGACCVEGDAGAPVEPDEIPGLEEAAEALGGELTAEARAVIDGQGVAYADRDGQLVTSIVDGKDCVFAVRDGQGCVLCAIDRARREGRTAVEKPLSCALYPVRLSKVGGVTALNYHRWDVCAGARAQGRRLALPVYRFLKAPLVRAFGQEWYDECELVATELRRQGYI